MLPAPANATGNIANLPGEEGDQPIGSDNLFGPEDLESKREKNLRRVLI